MIYINNSNKVLHITLFCFIIIKTNKSKVVKIAFKNFLKAIELIIKLINAIAQFYK